MIKIKQGIIGYGGMGSFHHKYIKDELSDINDVVAAYDIDTERVALAEAEGLTGYHTLEEFLQHDMNTVLVAVPNDYHKDLCIAAMRAGKNVICEKPVAFNVAELDEMLAVSKECGVMFTVHQNRRYDTDFNIVRKVVEGGMIGDVFAIESRLYGTGGTMFGWRGQKEHGGGMLYDWGIHLIDQILDLIKEPIVSVYAHLHHIINPECDDFFKLIIMFANGTHAQVEVSTYHCLPVPQEMPRFVAYGTGGAVRVDDFNGGGKVIQVKTLADEFSSQIKETSAGPTRTFAPRPDDVLITQELPEVKLRWLSYYVNYHKALNGVEPLRVQPQQVRRVMKVIDAAFESSRLNKSIDFVEDEFYK